MEKEKKNENPGDLKIQELNVENQSLKEMYIRQSQRIVWLEKENVELKAQIWGVSLNPLKKTEQRMKVNKVERKS
jgi:hypothetical protein